MANLPTTVHGYIELLENRCPQDPWPGDKELLAAYNVTPKDILQSARQKINEANLFERLATMRFTGMDDIRITVKLNDHYRISAHFKISETIPCTHCKADLLAKCYFKFYNLKNNTEMLFPQPILHLLEHDDLGNEPGLNIDPTLACKFFELGNTNLERNHPLYHIAQFRKDYYMEQTSPDPL